MPENPEYIGHYDGLIVRLRREVQPTPKQLHDWIWLWTRCLSAIPTAGATAGTAPEHAQAVMCILSLVQDTQQGRGEEDYAGI
jgi:hypothetical protein